VHQAHQLADDRVARPVADPDDLVVVEVIVRRVAREPASLGPAKISSSPPTSRSSMNSGIISVMGTLSGLGHRVDRHVPRACRGRGLDRLAHRRGRGGGAR
jgi:hypothetical protein